MVLDVMQMGDFSGDRVCSYRFLYSLQICILDSLGGNSEVDNVDRSVYWSTDLHKIRIWL